ncbi:MAG: beta-glucosidase [Alphaproteobacteria bacterium]|nr:beta-glucosidase [Alphaproteobacteria bacterium]
MTDFPRPAVPNGFPARVEPERHLIPRDFVWGVSTSAYQIEGAAKVDGRGPGIWDAYCREPGRIAGGDNGEVACDHYHRYAEDVALLGKVGVAAYRFSVAWPRVLPAGRGAANEAGLDFYDRLVDAVLRAGIEPWLCLYHWDLPQALQDEGGWLNRDSAAWFADYAALIAGRLGDRVRRFATFNEPSVFALFGYGFAWHPPAVADPAALHKAIHHVNLAHGGAVDALRAQARAPSIGCIHSMQPARAAGGRTAADEAAAALLSAYWNEAFPAPQNRGEYPPLLARAIAPHVRDGDMARIHRPVDWFGLNHYSPIFARADAAAPLGFAWADAPDDVPKTQMGWQVDPWAFRDTLIDVGRRYGLPVYVMENGAGTVEQPDASGNVVDLERVGYLAVYLSALYDALAAGADVRGYFVWSLLDNFEWGSGYNNRFGLVYVDYPTQRRIPKASAYWYAYLIRGIMGRVP